MPESGNSSKRCYIIGVNNHKRTKLEECKAFVVCVGTKSANLEDKFYVVGFCGFQYYLV